MDNNFLRHIVIADDDDAAIVAVVEDILDEDESEDDEALKHIFVDVQGWRTLSNSTFKENFRMSRTVFQRLIIAVGQHLLATNRLQRMRTPLDLSLLMGLWPIFNPDTFRSISKHFMKDKRVIYFHYTRIIEVLKDLAPKYIKWPTAVERDIIKTAFEEKFGYPGVIGCIDGVHIQVTAPLEQPQRYVNRHDEHSIIVQAVCDHNLAYRDIYVGEAGSIGDARNYQRSPLSINLYTNPEMVSNNEHILGDGAYTLTNKILIPYIDDGHLTPRQRSHNYILSSCRASIERSFALLRGKNRRLKKLPMRNMKRTIDHIVASFVLHNFIILEGHKMEGLPAQEINHVDQAQLDNLINEAKADGAFKREYIAHLLHP